MTVLLSEIASDLPQQQAANATSAAASAPVATPVAAPAPVQPPPPAPAPVMVTEPDPGPQPVPEPEPVVAAAPVLRTLRHWLNARSLPKRVRLQRGDHPPLLIDAAAGTWHGSATLKPLLALSLIHI